MKSKITDILYSFCISCSGLCLALLYRVDALTLLFVLTLSVAFSLFCCAISNRTVSKDYVKKIFALGALVSASVSVYIGIRLVCSFALDNSFIPICIFLCCTVALCFAVSSLRACKSVASVVSVFCILILAVILVLCLFDGGFDRVISGRVDRRIIFPLSVFGVIDAVFIMPYIRKNNRCMFVIGSALMPSYLLVTVLLAISMLSSKIYYSLDTPIITMWQSCYVASFIDRFETIAVCVLFAVCAVKSGIFLKCVFDIFKKYRAVLFSLLAVLVIPLILMPSLIFLYAGATLGCVMVYLINILLMK